MECSMSTTDKAWSCRISLRIVTGDGQYPTTQFGPLITDRKDVEIWIRRAQAAILNPNVAETEFLTKTEKELKKSSNALQFSKNVVCVHVSDPDLTDLSFVDLPGLIQNSNDDDITLIKDLVVDAISGSNTLILVTIPMSDDMQNQAAVRLARDADPAGERTIGVLTKPDGLSDGATGHLQSWKDVIEGKLHPLKHGYYCVRLPNDAERSRYKFRNDFQRFAAQFFETTTPWNTIADRSRFGVPNFVASISGLLVQLIEKNLPELRRRVEQLLAECVEELKGLPTALTTNDASTEVFLRITQFCQDFRSTVFGEQKRTLVQDNRRRYNLFKEDIYRSRPNFAPYLNSHHYLRPSDPEADRFPASGPVIDLPQVKQAIALYVNMSSSSIVFIEIPCFRSRGWELPTHLPFDATKDYILGFTRLWNQPAVSCFQDVFATTSEFIKTLMAQHFGQFRSLEKHVAFVVQAELNRCKTETTDALTKMLELESIPVFTQNNEFLLSERVRWLQLYYNSQFQHKTLHELYRNNDDYDALSVMADVRAYFQVAHKVSALWDTMLLHKLTSCSE
ncbi:hypothetical protein H0H87_009296 [Tephrocybe sp. NHM501043]|nr:hypothetical protein H0H87_009296 [Tephrocybe sp. NHM501043]